MKLVKPHYEIWVQKPGLDGIYKAIERAGRICYKSEDKITDDSAKPFVDRLINSGHLSVLEHGTVHLKVPFQEFIDLDESITYKPWNRFILHWQYPDVFLSTNYRWIVENHLEDWLQYYACKPTEYHSKRITVHFVCDRGVSHEFVRHRTFSFSQESTRYCNYSKDKFGNELTFIMPCWNYTKTANYNGKDEFDGDYFEHSLREDEQYYFKLLELGWKPQQARAVLPNILKTELVMTGFVDQWEEFFKLRDSSKAHPQAHELAEPLHEEFIAREYIKNGTKE